MKSLHLKINGYPDDTLGNKLVFALFYLTVLVVLCSAFWSIAT